MNRWLFHRLSFALFYFLLLLFMCSLFQGIMCVAQEKQPTDTVELFKLGTDETLLKPNGSDEYEKNEVKIDSVENVFLVATNELMVALAKAKITKTTSGSSGPAAVNFVAEHIKTKGDKTNEGIAQSDVNTRKKQLATDEADSSKVFSDEKSFAVVAKGSKIYFFVVKSTLNNGGPSDTANSDVVVVVGEVKNKSGDNTVDKTITWQSKEIARSSLGNDFAKDFKEKLKKGSSSISSTGSSAFLAGEKDKKIVFLVRNEAASGKENVTAFIQFKEEGGKQLELLHVETAKKCYPYFFPWGDKIMMIPTDCGADRSQKVKESINMVTWNVSNESFSRLWDVFQDKKGFTTTQIDGKPILFTYNNGANADIILWISDGTRMAKVGTIVSKSEGSFSGSILYTNGELFTVYQKDASPPSGTEKTFVLKYLKDVTGEITRVVSAWKNSDDAVTKLCTESAVSEKYDCATNFSKNGLVGFLSGIKEESDSSTWKDEYIYENAKLNAKEKAEKVPHGFRFSGDGAGAKWPVGKEQKDQPYNFADPGFTLLATVEIGKINDEKTFDNSLVGLILKEDNKRIGLLCSGGNWAVGDKTHILKKSGEHKCEQEETYIVGLVLEKNKHLAIFVDGKKLDDLDHEELNIGEGKNIAHFYFGADAEGAGDAHKLAKTDVTITNVLLYNRPFKEDEIKNIKATKRENPKIPTPPLNGTISTQEDGKSTGETDRPSSTSATPTATEKDGAEIKLCSPLKNDFTLFALLLLVGLTLLARYV